jgi:hypothetical protein
MSDEGTTCSIIRFDIGRFGSSMEFPEVKTPSYVAEPDRPHMFEIRAPIYGVVGAFIVIEEPRSPRGAVDVSFVAKDKWFMKVARFLWPFPRWRRQMVEAYPPDPQRMVRSERARLAVANGLLRRWVDELRLLVMSNLTVLTSDDSYEIDLFWQDFSWEVQSMATEVLKQME